MYNKNMSNSVGKKEGFTIIEVMLFLALTGLVFAGVVGGTNGNIAKERYRDSVQDVANQLKTIYSDVRNVKIPEHDENVCQLENYAWHMSHPGETVERKRGRSVCAVYGRLVSIFSDGQGETHIQSAVVYGNDYLDLSQKIQTASVTPTYLDSDIWPGDAYYLNGQDKNGDKNKQPVDLSSLSDLDLYKVLRADIGKLGSMGVMSAIGFELKDVKPQWGATIVKKQKTGEPKQNLRAYILIARSPISGVVHTYVHELDLTPEEETQYANKFKGDLSFYQDMNGKSVQGKLMGENEQFVKKDLRLCIDSSNETVYGGQRRMIKIVKDAHNETGVELVNFDTASKEDQCQ